MRQPPEPCHRQGESVPTEDAPGHGFQQVLDQIRADAGTEAAKGRRFERLMKAFFEQDALYRNRFAAVRLWSEWAADRPDFTRVDTGIDLVAEERDGGVCAVQTKCHAPGTRISKAALDSFIAASAREPFTARLVVDTGDEWGRNAVRTIEGLQPACSVLRFGDLVDRPFDWPDLKRQRPEDLRLRSETFHLRPHQRQARDAVLAGFRDRDRGKLIMACGTGKTFTALRIAERIAGTGGRVLYLVPSISLLQQSMREWAEQRAIEHRYIGICSDTRAGRTSEDASLVELEIPVTTEPDAISQSLRSASPETMTVVFCTYHSLGLIEAAQAQGAPPFDLILCDEAHRTTGVERPGDTTSPFVLVHDRERIRGARRLYLTATPRLFTEGAKTRAANHGVDVFSMDDETAYGPEFHRLPFSRAVEQGLLSDYKVAVLAVSETHVDRTLQAHLASSGGELNLSDAARIVGCWRVLQNPENRKPDEGPIQPVRRAIAFTDRIVASERLAKHWGGLVEEATTQLAEEERDTALRCETQHVDGRNHALDRRARIDWLKGETDGGCRILSNARCLSEGIDVPALDAVIFMSERKSVVDIVQAVGRVMRKADGKDSGYIVLPIAVAAGRDPATVLDRGKEFDVVWSVLRALRSHDDRLDAEINQIDLNKRSTSRIIFHSDGPEPAPGPHLPFPPLDFPPGAIEARIVEKCGDRKYWERWAKDVAAIFRRLVIRIGALLDDPANDLLARWFEEFHRELRESINQSITTAAAIDMMAQHIVTGPVFEALFDGYDFAGGNPVARVLEKLRTDFEEFGLENETRDLEGFYESVRLRARGLDNPEARQAVLMELYQKFFATALKKDAERLGIVYTPTAIVDFILKSADDAARAEFGKSLGDEGVHVLDPFTGTGVFLVRLLQSALIPDTDLRRKYSEELHANEIVLLAYYIAAIHIEEAFRGRTGGEGYEPFGGIVLTDTFNLTPRHPGIWLPENSERAERQQRLPIQVIVGNPPWSAGQRSSSDENPNLVYPAIRRRIAETYAARSTATLKNSLYDTYKMAIRQASDRIGERGILAFVTNGSWIDGHVDSGVRACLAEEFSSIHVVNLRGNQRTQGERSRREGGKVFGQGSRAPVAITILARNPNRTPGACRIRYRDIGDSLSRKDKLETLRTWGSIAGIGDWEEITPDRHHDWIGKRDPAFRKLQPLGSEEAKRRRSDDAVFGLFSNGYKTGRDSWVYNFSRETCAENARRMVDAYRNALEVREQRANYSVEDAVKHHASHIPWDEKLKSKLKAGERAAWSRVHIRKTQYRPFVKQNGYIDPLFAQRRARQHKIFPVEDTDNRAICVTGTSSTKPFSALVVDTMPDLELISKGQCFPRYRFEPPRVPSEHQAPLERVDNISEIALRKFREHYRNTAIIRDAIFEYVYGVLHAPAWRERFAHDLTRELPRVPFAADFTGFANAGERLAALHLGYETGAEYPLELRFSGSGEPKPEHFRISGREMRFEDDARSMLIVNEHLRLTGIPPEAHRYEVNGRTPLGWFIDRYRIKRENGILNDPNEWFDDPHDLIRAFRRIVHVSVETAAIVAALPDPFAEPEKRRPR